MRETCDGIWLGLKDEYLKAPSSPEDWVKIAAEYFDEWNFPNCLGAIDGKHVDIDCPKDGGSAYYNYKGFHSIVLLAICVTDTASHLSLSVLTEEKMMLEFLQGLQCMTFFKEEEIYKALSPADHLNFLLCWLLTTFLL